MKRLDRKTNPHTHTHTHTYIHTHRDRHKIDCERKKLNNNVVSRPNVFFVGILVNISIEDYQMSMWWWWGMDTIQSLPILEKPSSIWESIINQSIRMARTFLVMQ